MEASPPAISIKFNTESTELWQKMTVKNIDKAIAIVMDQQVYSAPIVKSEIKQGNCMISGDFSEKELKVFVAIVKNGELASSFKIRK